VRGSDCGMFVWIGSSSSFSAGNPKVSRLAVGSQQFRVVPLNFDNGTYSGVSYVPFWDRSVTALETDSSSLGKIDPPTFSACIASS
jgi:hypothetical protein